MDNGFGWDYRYSSSTLNRAKELLRQCENNKAKYPCRLIRKSFTMHISIGDKKINTCCPYCGSNDICADVDIRITGKLQKDGTIRANDWWLQRSTLEDEAIGATSSEDINGFCSNCGAYCAFDWKKGYIPYPKKIG